MGYYRGDYYRGDPFLGALVGGIVGKAAGRAASWVGRRIGGAAGRSAAAGVARDAVPGAIAGAAGFTVGRQMPSLSPIPQMGPTASGPGAWFGGERKRYRRMNPLNPRALKRALRRAEGFEKFAKKTVNALYRVVDGRRVKTYKKTRRSS